MSAYKIDISSDSIFVLDKTLEIIFESDYTSVTGYKITPENELIFYWSNTEKEIIPFPFKTKNEALKPIILGWLKETLYPKEPNIDGSIKKGWRICNFKYYGCTLFTVEPKWIVYGK